tara:strand:- start:1132 stop:1389 length:258 start_codon:yes stop_codon:yes gene_type:complete
MKCYSLVIEPKLVKQIDALIKKHGLYSSRSDFIRDAIRQRLIEIKQVITEKVDDEKATENAEREARREDEILEKAMDEFKYRGVH